jgi:hypothetical protein
VGRPSAWRGSQVTAPSVAATYPTSSSTPPSHRPAAALRSISALVLDGLRTDAAHPLPGHPLNPETMRQAMSFD